MPNNNPSVKHSLITSTRIWLALFALAPTLLLITASFLSHDTQHLLKLPFSLTNYQTLWNPLYLKLLMRSLFIAAICTLFCLLIGYPFSFILSRIKSKYRFLLFILIIIPFWTSSLIRSYAIMTLLKAKGLINSTLLWLGIIHQPLQLLYTNTALIIGLVYNLLPFMILPLYVNMNKLDEQLIEAARDLGANTLTLFYRIILPLTLPGIVVGIIMVFLPATTLFYIPTLLGGAKSMLLGNLIENEFLAFNNWPLGSAMSVILLVMMLAMLAFYWRSNKKITYKSMS